MKRFLIALVLAASISGIAVARDFPRVEIYGGYSAQRLGITDENLDSITSGMEEDFELICPGCESSVSSSRFLKKGFEGAFAVNVTSYFGLVFDVRYGFDDIVTGSVTNNDDTDVNATIKYTDLSVMGGPRFAIRTGSVTPFVHALVGMDRGKVSYELTGTSTESGEEENDGIGVAVGGGFDVNLGDTVALRLGQVDYYLTRHNEEFLKNIAFSGGIVFRFGWVY
ncbi:MAG: outer membrane beta-barrel protein [Acidobacteria bacterium]|nr:outer membrane beta-barrel protein [Acidobacteriota bacterium]